MFESRVYSYLSVSRIGSGSSAALIKQLLQKELDIIERVLKTCMFSISSEIHKWLSVQCFCPTSGNKATLCFVYVLFVFFKQTKKIPICITMSVNKQHMLV